MQRHHHETNPHFIRLQSQNQQLGSPPSQWNQPTSPPPRRHGKAPDPAGPPLVQIRSRGQSDRPSRPLDHDRGRAPIRPMPLSPEETSPQQHGQNRGPPSTRPLPLSPEEPSPLRPGQHRGQTSTRPLLLSPEEAPHPQHGRHRAPVKPRPLSQEKPTPHHGHHEPHHSHGPRIPPPKRTNPITWSAAVCCAIFWVIIILGGLIVLIVYLVYRPHSPHFEITSVTLNAAYLDMGFLLNSDLTLLGNFTNPSKKGTVHFSYVTFDLYYGNTLIASQYIEPFSADKAQSMFAYVHLVTSQVRLFPGQIQQLKRQIDSNGIVFDVRGRFHVRSSLGSVLRYSYWLYSHCSIIVTGPPSGVLRARRCNTKR